MSLSLAALCGLFCGSCEHLDIKCEGCGAQKGKPFWTSTIKVESCPLYNCCANTKQLEHCGLRSEFPCETINQLRDPSLSDKEANVVLLERQKDLIRRKQIGTQEWLKEKQKTV